MISKNIRLMCRVCWFAIMPRPEALSKKLYMVEIRRFSGESIFQRQIPNATSSRLIMDDWSKYPSQLICATSQAWGYLWTAWYDSWNVPLPLFVAVRRRVTSSHADSRRSDTPPTAAAFSKVPSLCEPTNRERRHLLAQNQAFWRGYRESALLRSPLPAA